MTTEATQTPPRPKPGRALKVLATLFALLSVLMLFGSAALYKLGKVDPRDPATAKLAWGDRVEKRLDAVIDKNRPKWADRLEAKLDGLARRMGWN
ncbi:MAG: hypothetical protein QM758_12375 [Armatimonas sp.]